MALTATASEAVINDVVTKLGMDGCVKLVQSFNRPNLRYEVVPKKRNPVGDIATYIKNKHAGKTGIIYCLGRNKCEDVAQELRSKWSINARHYHAQMDPEDRQRAQDEWQAGTCKVIVATVRSFLLRNEITL
jgi:superfamily II DNA helicase RecQ